MKKNKMKIWVGCGIFCVLSMVISLWYAITYNDSRLAVPMDFKDYVFQVEDLPMILSASFTCIYVIALFLKLFIYIGKGQRQGKELRTTRIINSKLGFLGVLGFLGFLGFYTYSMNGTIFPFAFFLFFGFFGFFYEGKMAGTFMDERFCENKVRAQLKAYKITFLLILITLVILCQGKFFGSFEYTLIVAIIILSLTLAFGIFLSEYFLYRYDHDDQIEEREE